MIAEVSLSPLVLLKPGSNQPPVFLTHGLGGSLGELHSVIRQMESPGPVYGLQLPGSDGREQPLDSIEQMAHRFVSAIRQVQPHGPYLLMGYSLGGLVTLETARQFLLLEEQIGLLVMIDSYPHFTRLSLAQRWRLRARLVWRRITRRARTSQPSPQLSPAAKRFRDSATHSLECYVPRFYRGAVHFIRAGRSHKFSHQPSPHLEAARYRILHRNRAGRSSDHADHPRRLPGLRAHYLGNESATAMTGAEAIVRTLIGGGVDTCFTNPGNTEIHLVAVLDRMPETRCVLGLFEGVITGAADGYARMTGKPAWTLLHLGPGFANGLANLHNAARAHVPMIHVIGQHATYHIRRDTPLTSDIEAIARPYSQWLRTSCAAPEVGHDVAEAITASRTAPGRIATLIVPSDVSWSEGGIVPPTPSLVPPPVPSGHTVEQTAALLRSGVRTAILLDGNALYGAALITAGQIAHATGAKLLAPYPLTRLQRGAGLPVVERVHYILEPAKEQLQEFAQLILVGSSAPVAYFAYPGKDSTLTSPECRIQTLARPGEDCAAAIHQLADALQIDRSALPPEPGQRPIAPHGEITPAGIAAAIGALLPHNTIVVDESMTSGRDLMSATRFAPAHDWLGNTGGAIGIAMPLAIGAAVACPDRQVLCLSADGSGMYTLQALWTMAREGLRIVTVIFANRTYGVLKREFSYLGVGAPGPRASAMFDIGRPDLDWVHLAQGMGVPAIRVTSVEAFSKALGQGFESHGPLLIEVPL